MKRQYNLIGRGESETRERFVVRAKSRMMELLRFRSTPQFDSADLLRVSFGAVEVRGEIARFLDGDGRVVAEMPLDIEASEPIQSFGGFGGSILRAEVDPMTDARARKILDGFTDKAASRCSADELDALAYAARRGWLNDGVIPPEALACKPD